MDYSSAKRVPESTAQKRRNSSNFRDQAPGDLPAKLSGSPIGGSFVGEDDPGYTEQSAAEIPDHAKGPASFGSIQGLDFGETECVESHV